MVTGKVTPPSEYTHSQRRCWYGCGILFALVLGAALRIAFYYVDGMDMKFFGDEGYHYSTSKRIYELIAYVLDGGVTHDILMRKFDHVVRGGWHMPGVSMLLAPSHLLGEDLRVVRAYIGVVNFVLLCAVTYKATKLLELPMVLIFVTIVSVFPVIIIKSFGLWGEVPAGLILIFIALHWLGLYKKRGENLTYPALIKHAAFIGGLLVIAIYIRVSLILAPPIIALFIATILWKKYDTHSSLKRVSVYWVVMFSVIVLGLSPWSYAMSKKFGGFYVTTTSVDLNFICTFGKSVLGKSACRGNWIREHDRYVRQAKREGGVSYAEIASKKRWQIINGLTLVGYAKVVQQNMAKMFFAENKHMFVYKKGGGRRASGPFYSTLKAVNSMMWYAMLAILCVALYLLWAGKMNRLFYGMLLCLSSILIVQAFGSVSQSRFYPLMIPILSLVVAKTFILVIRSCYVKHVEGNKRPPLKL